MTQGWHEIVNTRWFIEKWNLFPSYFLYKRSYLQPVPGGQKHVAPSYKERYIQYKTGLLHLQKKSCDYYLYYMSLLLWIWRFSITLILC